MLEKCSDYIYIYILFGNLIISFCLVIILKKMKVKHEVINVTHENKGKYKKILGRNTFPQLVLGDAKLGGFDELERIVAVCRLLKRAKIELRAVNYICNRGN